MKTGNDTPRVPLQGDHFTRTFTIADLSKESAGKVGEVCSLLNDCFPVGNFRDVLGATPKQLTFISKLAKLSREEDEDFFDTIIQAGGISSWQAHHMIEELKSG